MSKKLKWEYSHIPAWELEKYKKEFIEEYGSDKGWFDNYYYIDAFNGWNSADSKYKAELAWENEIYKNSNKYKDVPSIKCIAGIYINNNLVFLDHTKNFNKWVRSQYNNFCNSDQYKYKQMRMAKFSSGYDIEMRPVIEFDDSVEDEVINSKWEEMVEEYKPCYNYLDAYKERMKERD